MSKQVAVVTGASRGIGRAIAENLGTLNYQVVYAARSSPQKLPKGAIYVPCDISNAESRQNLLEETLKQCGAVHLLVNNAGVAPAQRLDILETTEESFAQLMKINLEGTFFMCQIFASHMVKQGGKGCRIVNIASISSYTSSTNRGEYCISKAGVSMVTSLFADKLAEHGIGVFEVRPGIIMTDMTASVTDKYQKLIDEGLTPTKRFGMPQDVAHTVNAIAKGHFDFSTGQVFNVDGGFHLRRL